MTQVVIVEDEARAAARLKEYLERYEKETGENFQITVFADAYAFLDGYKPCQLVFMDIEMPGLNGLDAAKRLRQVDDDVQIIFVTNMAQCAVAGYEVRTMDFIVKPVEYASFTMKMKRVLRYISMHSVRQITIKRDKNLIILDVRRLSYIEVRGHNLVYHTDGGIIEARGKMTEVEEQLAADHFVRCNHCYLVNLAYVTAVQGLSVVVGGEELRMSRAKRPHFIDCLTEYLGGGGAK